MIETALFVMGEKDYDLTRIEYAVRMFEKWYVGDGTYVVIGRSVSYRFGAFQALAQAALLGHLPMGLSMDHAFWTEQSQDWTAKKIWSGANVSVDHAID